MENDESQDYFSDDLRLMLSKMLALFLSFSLGFQESWDFANHQTCQRGDQVPARESKDAGSLAPPCPYTSSAWHRKVCGKTSLDGTVEPKKP